MQQREHDDKRVCFQPEQRIELTLGSKRVLFFITTACLYICGSAALKFLKV